MLEALINFDANALMHSAFSLLPAVDVLCEYIKALKFVSVL
jgi:hypothetical protein